MAFLLVVARGCMTVAPSPEEQWRQGVATVTAAFLALPPALRQRLRQLSDELARVKGAMQDLVAQVGAALHCAACGGECCVAGRYHFSRADLLVYLATERELFVPLFDNGLCPYLAREGCLMPTGYRPFNCISFNCDRIEDLLPPE